MTCVINIFARLIGNKNNGLFIMEEAVFVLSMLLNILTYYGNIIL